MAATEIVAGASLGEKGRYRLLELIGTGGMASVWIAHDSRLERDVAVKVLADVLALDADYIRRFEREARLAAGLSHPHLVSLFDFSAHGTRPYLVMEYVAGGTLADQLRARRVPNWDPVVLASELLDAIGYIHGAGIIHRDIKPANVLIGVDGRARLTDFGIAQHSGATRITLTGQVIGSQRYIAPEVFRGQQANERSDLYALGVLLGECLRPGTSPRLGGLVKLLADEDPRRRPASATEALVILHGSPTTATRVLPRRAGAHLSRAAAVTIAVLALLVVGLAIVASGGGGGSGAGRATNAIAPPPNAPLEQQLTQLDNTINRSRR
jgi:serine/threonine protein kinase